MQINKTTNEWEFQGAVLEWINAEIIKRPGMGLDRATQEPSKVTPQRNDLVVWRNRIAENAFLTIELKTPTTSIMDPTLLQDAFQKAQRWNAPYFAIWNMQTAEIYETPCVPLMVTPQHRFYNWPTDGLVKKVEDWLNPKCEQSLHKRAMDILDKAWGRNISQGKTPLALDASIFVERLSLHLKKLQSYILPALRKVTSTKPTIRKKLKELGAAMGFLGFVNDFDAAIAGQYSYRLVGQILFYFALRRKQPGLDALNLSPEDKIPDALRPYWDNVRRYDYEALFQPNLLDDLVPVPEEAQNLVRGLIKDLAVYDWNELHDDVLGAIFEHLIPREEQALLGQFYTRPSVADLLVSLSVVRDPPLVLDPGCGSGTFLLRTYDFLKNRFSFSHDKLLSLIWGFDISAFAAELAVINLFRQNLSVFENFPRIVPGDFFERLPGQEIPFPPAKNGGQEKIMVAIPKFTSIIGNPPYLRSQNQDDLNPKYRNRLFSTAVKNIIKAPAKTDLFAFFLYKALDFLVPGGRIGFVTSSSWLTADFGTPIKKLLLDRLRLVAVFSSSAESFFSQVDINTTLIITELRDKPGIDKDEALRFVTLKRRISEIFPPGKDYWARIIAFMDTIESAKTSFETEDFRLTMIPAAAEKKALSNNHYGSRNWSLYLRAPASYFQLFGDDA
jgi:methylase of polypeptide subunit release factors